MAASLFCEHKRLRSVCALCGSARAGAATPQRGAITHDIDDTLHAYRAECHARAKKYLTLVHEGRSSADAYASAYDKPAHRGKVVSEEEDPATFRGGFYWSMIKLFDVTIDERRIQGYNGLADWEEMRDYVFRKLTPAELATALKDGRVTIHGGNGAWPRQQIASELVRSDRLQEAMLRLAFGEAGVPAGDASDDDIIARLTFVEKLAPRTMQLSSKVLHVFAPQRWPALTPRTTPDVGEDLEMPIPAVESPADYVRFAEAMRAIMKAKKHVDLDRTDILVADAWEMLHAESDEPDAEE